MALHHLFCIPDTLSEIWSDWMHPAIAVGIGATTGVNTCSDLKDLFVGTEVVKDRVFIA